MKYSILILLLVLTTNIKAQMFWQRPIVNYNRHEYNAANQNWMIAQHPNGWMYFANNKGLLEYDGTYWNCYPIPHHAKLRSILIGKDNKIYIGGLKEFGFFTPNPLGGLNYHSLSKNLSSHIVSNIWNIHLIDNKVYYQGDRCFFCYENGRIIPIDCDGVSYSAVINNQLYFNNEKGLSILKGKRAIEIPHSQFFCTSNVVSILPFQKKILIVTPEHGLYTYDGKTFQKAFTSIDVALAAHRVSCASISNNTLAIGTEDDGLYLINLNNLHIERINLANGLQNKSLLSVKFDQENNLWLGLDNGIDYISLDTHMFFLNSKLSSIGAGYCSQYANNKLYLGTNQGVYVSSIPASINEPVDLSPMPEMTGLVHCIYPYDGKIFCGGKNFFCQIDGGKIQNYGQRGVWHIQAIKTDIMLVGTYWGLEVMRKEKGTWRVTNKIAGCNISAKTMYLEPESGNIWVANKTDGLWRMTLDTSFRKILHKKCYNNRQLPKGDNVYVARIGKDIVVTSHQGLFKYDSDKDVLKPYKALENKLDGPSSYSYIKQDGHGSIWYVSNGILKIANLKNNHKVSYLGDNMIEDFEDVNLQDSRQAIVGTEDGFALIDRSKKKQKQHKLNLYIRKFYVTNGKDSLVYGQDFGSSTEPFSIRYRDNSIRIEYGCDNYDRTRTITYAYRLEGVDKKWSEFTPSTTKEYTDLPEGTYTFRVKIRPDESSTDIETSITFKVLPPWYRSWWAYTLYILLIAYAVRYTIHRYKRGRERLIRMKDAEMNRQKATLERDIDEQKKQIDKLEEEKLRNELNYKSDELVKTTLNVVRKNEILQKIKKDAESLSRTINEGNLVNVRRGILRFINQIDTNIEHDSDLDNFQSSFDAVHNDFLKKLGEQYPQLTHKDKMLCAYIKMNLMSKEIAPLLNISVRGVEISRYRLRKKLGLDEKANLAEFLQKLT